MSSPLVSLWLWSTWLVVANLFLFFHSSNAFSNQVTKDQTDLEEVVVIASLLPMPLSRAASAITVIDSQQLKDRLALDVSDLLRDIPGVSVSRSGVMGSQTQVRMRGAEANHVLVLIDGVEANDPSLADETSWGSLSAVNIQRIEVIRGPQSALYGSDAMAGVISLTTNLTEKPYSADFFSEVGNYSTYRSGVNAGYVQENINIGFSGSHFETSGDNIARSGNEKDGYRNKTWNLRAGLTLSDQLRASIMARGNHGVNFFDADDDYDGLVEDRDYFTQTKSFGYRAILNYQSADELWHHRLALSEASFDNHNYKMSFSNGLTRSTKRNYQYVGSRLWETAQQQLSVLIESEREDYRQAGGYAFGRDADATVERKSEGIAIEYRVDPFERLTLGMSGRYDQNDNFSDPKTYRLETIYRSSGNTSWRATLGSGIKNPTFTELFGIYSGFYGNPNLQPESSKSWSLGLDHQFFAGKLDVSLDVFKARLKQEIKTVYAADWTSTAINFDGNSDRRGIEFFMDWDVTQYLDLTLAYTYIDSVEQDNDGNEIDELRRPEHLASLNASWNATPSLGLNVNLQYNGTQSDLYFPPWPSPMERVVLDDYMLLNFHANYSLSSKFDLYLKIDNLLDENYEDVFGYQTLGLGARVGGRYVF